MKAIILCGGKGTRLHPLTEDLPKPLVPFGNKPLLFRIIQQLINSNIHEIMLTLGHQKDQIKAAVQAENFNNCNLYFQEESTPLGTAGSVYNCREFINEDVFIISGDCVIEGDFKAFIEDFYQQNANVSIGASIQNDPTEFGCILVDSSHSVQGFIEKPMWDQVETDLVSTGIYIIKPEILDTIQKINKVPCDFAKDIFPEILNKNQKIHVYQFENYWCDIGTPEAYLKAAMHFGFNDDNKNILWKGVEIGENSIVRHCILGKNVKVGKNTILQNAFVGSNTIIEDNVCVVNAKVDGRMTLAKGTSVTGIVRRTGAPIIRKNLSGDTELLGDLSYEFIVKICNCISLFFEEASTVAIVSCSDNRAVAISTFIQAGLLACGREVRTGRNISLSAFRWMIRNGFCDGGIYVTHDRIRILNEKGNDLNQSQRRKLNGIYQKQETVPTAKQFYATEEIPNPEEYYYTELIKRFPATYRTLEYWGRSFTQEERTALIAKIIMEFYPDCPLFITKNTGLLAEKMAKEQDRYVVRCGNKIGDVQDEMEKLMHIPGVYEQYLMYTDDFALDLAASMYCARKKDISFIQSTKVYIQEIPISCKKDQCATLLRKLYEGGYLHHKENENVAACANDQATGLRIYVESFNEEYSRELSIQLKNKVQEIVDTLS